MFSPRHVSMFSGDRERSSDRDLRALGVCLAGSNLLNYSDIRDLFRMYRRGTRDV